jgi:hypothetical protein
MGPDANRSIIHIGSALIVWLVGTTAAQVLVLARGLHID